VWRFLATRLSAILDVHCARNQGEDAHTAGARVLWSDRTAYDPSLGSIQDYPDVVAAQAAIILDDLLAAVHIRPAGNGTARLVAFE